ncbi:MAG: amino acid permease [Candidatus Marinimicrobia bacterium]|jgi:amino acid transporter|nr:amino acid permease [Candidatus Neomarinimicrobiota bacterium]MDP7330276.1 amino acid permease [Candidatus Neomarinimicrobiota bacterium]HBN45073.1 amino acid permease [Candidatus Neomarinimicrobiota bacterium]HJL73980.1 amino acid permease [Candidatus Neomarinimicrobiota bacterium]|tara:strand:- start:1544 stop:2902 length:1359 start_codon:yes stop_codon:yes gene_type:complete
MPIGKQLSLKRDLGPISGYATIIGILVGAGIFRVTGEAGAVAGSAVPFAYLLFAPIVLSTAVAYSIFVSTPLGMRPGGAYIHISRTFGNYYLGFIAMWMKLVAFVGAISFMSTSFGEYMTYFLPSHDPRMWGTIVLLFFYGINIVGVRYYGQFQTAMLIVLILSILILVIPGIPAIDYAHYKPLLPKGFSGLLDAMPMLFFSYAGFETLAQVAGETKDPTRTLPMIFIKGVLASVFIFFIMSFVAFGVLPADVLASSNSAMADVAAQYLPPWGSAIVALGAMSAFLTSINGSILVPSRMLFVFSEDRLMPGLLASIHPKWRTPHISLIISAIICTTLIWSQSARYLMNAGLIGIFIIYFFQGIALIALPIVNKRLYNSAKVRLPKWLLYLVGTLTAVPMGYFLIITIAEVFIFTFFGLIVGTVLYIWGRKQGKKEGFNYRARMEQDYHLLEQ